MWAAGRLLKRCSRERPEALVAGWLGEAQEPVLLALDAPLGWPMGLAQALVSHRAGEALVVEPNQMFRRATDRFIQRSVGKTPLDVGADRIARTAHAALRLLRDLRKESRRSISLAWSPELREAVSVIEVYPAATLKVHGVRSAGYKKPGDKAARSEIIDALRTHIELPDDIGALEHDANALDAVVCLLAAKDFLEGQSMPPENRQLAEQEGWIWSRTSSRGVLEESNAAAETEEVGVTVGRAEGGPRAEDTSLSPNTQKRPRGNT